MANSKKPKIAFVSTYGCQCGIANFTKDLIENTRNIKPYVLALMNGWNPDTTQKNIVKTFQIRKYELPNYFEMADWINKNADVVNIQHEFAIFGGEKGEYIIPFLEKIEKPIVTTLHTVNSVSATKHKKKIVDYIAKKSDALVVISPVAEKLLSNYSVDGSKVTVIPHGVHSIDSNKETAKKKLGLENRLVITTFGLLSQKKGIDDMIDALPSILECEPNAVYVIAGQAHSKNEDKNYSRNVKGKVSRLGLKNNVKFIENYLDLDSLKLILQATDVGDAAYNSQEHVSSGCLAYFMSAGAVPIATRYPYAVDMLQNQNHGQKGFLVDYNSPEAIADIVIKLIKNPDLKKEMASNARNCAASMQWPDMAEKYRKLFCSLS